MYPLRSHRWRLTGIFTFVAIIGVTVYACDPRQMPTAVAPHSRVHFDQSPYWPDEPANFATISTYGFDDTIPAGSGVEL